MIDSKELLTKYPKCLELWCKAYDKSPHAETSKPEIKKESEPTNSKPILVQKTAPKAVASPQSDFRIENGALKEYKGKDGNVVIPNNVTSIGANAFWGRKSLIL